MLHYAMYSRANRNHFGRLLSFEDQGQHINRVAAKKVFKKLHIRSGINLGDIVCCGLGSRIRDVCSWNRKIYGRVEKKIRMLP